MKIECPHCSQRLEVDDEMVGLTVNCPTCNKAMQLPNVTSRMDQSTIPALKPVIRLTIDKTTDDKKAAGKPSSGTQTRAGLYIAFALGLVVGVVGTMGASKFLSSGSATLGSFHMPSFGPMTREEFRAKIEQNKIYKHRAVDKNKFIEIMGKPDKTSVVDDEAFWFYECKDGTIQLVLQQAWLEMKQDFKDGGVCIQMINEL